MCTCVFFEEDFNSIPISSCDAQVILFIMVEAKLLQLAHWQNGGFSKTPQIYVFLYTNEKN